MRTPERKEFLMDVFTTAIENYGYGAFSTLRYKWQNLEKPFADIRFDDDEPGCHGRVYHVSTDTVAHGIAVIREHYPEAVGLSPDNRKAILDASRDNDASNIDVVLALAVLECALFGKVTYC